MTTDRLELFKRRRVRVRNKLRRINKEKLRLSVHRSSKNIYVQVIDDRGGKTLASASTLEPKLKLGGKNNMAAAQKIGKLIAERAKLAGVEEVYFDRGGFLFHGKVKALAEAARENGLKF